MKKEGYILYGILMVAILAISVIGSTYAYITATTSSSNNSVKTKSTIYKISMNINPIYDGFSFIPMNDTDALKAVKNKCKDKYDRGACSAYKILVYDYDENLNYISGYMNITTENMKNISYMMLEKTDEYNEDNCVQIEEKNYCVAKEATKAIEEEDLSIGDSYQVSGLKEKELILVMWLTNLNESQNEFDVGSYQATVTIQAGNGGEVKGTIASAVKLDPTPESDGV